jgi:hypothetical protein
MVQATGEQRQNEKAMTDGSGRIRDRETEELECLPRENTAPLIITRLAADWEY